jgi:hypothetical protein
MLATWPKLFERGREYIAEDRAQAFREALIAPGCPLEPLPAQ